MSEEPRLPDAFDKFNIPLWAKLLIGLPAIGLPVVILLFILRTEYAHDESRCPYQQLEVRRFNADIELVEERRRCLDDVEDRRYSVRRVDVTRVLGRRRLPPSAFETPAYQWTADLRHGQMFIKVTANGHPPAEFREGTDEERAY